MLAVFCNLINSVRARLHGGWGPQVGQVTCLAGYITRLSIIISQMVTPPIIKLI